MTHQFSALIIVKGRKDHLLNVIAGIERASLIPDEVVIVHMNEDAYAIDSNLPISQHVLRSSEPLPLAAARNKAADIARYETLCFLDVDCIPDETFFEEILRDAAENTIVMADPRYLAKSVSTIDFNDLQEQSHANPVRTDLPFGPSNNYEMFWSLGFTIPRTAFTRIGGFDESFTGYGGEDTDFAFTAQREGVKMVYSRATLFHQPHPEYDPPLNWLKDIVVNARVFYKKWGIWPMQGWLNKFESSGYIRRDDDAIEIIRAPTDEEIRRTQR